MFNTTPQNGKSLEEYFNDYPTYFLSDLETIKNSMFNNQRLISTILPPNKKTGVKTRRNGAALLSDNWDEIGDVIIGIRDNEQLINTLNTCKRQKMGLGYIFIESLQYVSVIIKKSNSYPLVIIRIPIEQPFVYADGNLKSVFFEFPLEQLIVKENNSKSKNRQYRLYLTKTNGYTLTLETLQNNEVKKRTIENIKQCDNIVVNELLKSTMTQYFDKFKMDKITDISYSLNNMNISIITKLPNNKIPIIFEQLKSKQVGYMEFDKDTLKFIIKGVNRKDEQNVLTKDESLYWPQISYDKNKYVLHNYDPMFKISHYSLGTSKDSNYYLFTTFQNTYMFIKLITDQNICINNNSNTYTFQDLFNKGTHVMEMYLLIQDNEI